MEILEVNGAKARLPLLDVGVASRPIDGLDTSGDRHLVTFFDGGALVALVDGLGHGPDAAYAAEKALAALSNHADGDIISLTKRCHDTLINTRGAVMSLASFNARDNSMSWLGVGNVEGLLLRADPEAAPKVQSVLLRGGTLGFRLPPLRANTLPVAHGDTLVFVSDGISGAFRDCVNTSDSPQVLADHILDDCGKHTDDALALVVRYLG